MANNHQLLQTFVHSSPGEKIPSSLRKLLSRTNEASLSVVISRLEHERQGLTDGGGERWRRTVVENGGIRRRISAGAIRKPKRCLYGPGELETEVSGSSSRFVVGFLCNRASVVSVFPCEEGCCVDELWRLDNALRSRFGKTEQRHRGHFTFKHSHWSMHSTWKLWAQVAIAVCILCSSQASLSSLLLFDKFHYIYVESRIGSQCLMDPITPCT
ncbi:unnamed protein product [Brassica rapa]|uniref:Uncharacterized protein n=1 Tax=Brassica campestris TaxID=3711 RepID=A0A8D9FYR0_BRACM|nr:unnamed protein product [Brassica rapa]